MLNKIRYNEEGYWIKKRMSFFNKSKVSSKVSVITPVYNAEKYLRKTIDSIVNQSFGFKHIEYILVDDGSTDSSRKILLEYAKQYENIVLVFLKHNTGTPGQPRNLGIKLAKSKYITFLDADDWLDADAIKTLYDILEETGDDYVVGKTVQIESKESKIIGEQESCKERRSVSPFSIPHMFHHLAPRARMVRSEVIKTNNIRFPEMKFAEDKQFFIDVLINCKSISTTSKVIYCLNRLNENDNSITKKTNIIQKTDCNIKVIKHVIAKGLAEEKEKMILNRLYEFDSITRLFDRQHFLRSKDKQIYYEKFKEVLETTKDLRYDFSENFFNPINKVAYELFREGKYDEFEKLFKWNKNVMVKDYIIKDNLPYRVSPLEGEHKYIRVPMLAVFKRDYFEDDKYKAEFVVYGDFVTDVNDVLLRDRKEVTREYAIEANVDSNGNGYFELDLNLLSQFSPSLYGIFLRYNDYRKINITKQERVKYYNNRTFRFYTTIHANLGLQIREPI